MRKLRVEELQKGDLIVVRWIDASNHTATLKEHENTPELPCKDWGIFLGISGRKRKFFIIGKDVVEVHNEWGATRIPLELVEEITLLMPREQVMRFIREIHSLGRRVKLRKYSRRDAEHVRVA